MAIFIQNLRALFQIKRTSLQTTFTHLNQTEGQRLEFLPDRYKATETTGARNQELVLLRDVYVRGAEGLSLGRIVLQLGDADRHLYSGGDIRPKGLYGGRYSQPSCSYHSIFIQCAVQ